MAINICSLLPHVLASLLILTVLHVDERKMTAGWSQGSASLRTHREPLVRLDFDHSFQQILTVRRYKVGHMKHAALHFLQELPQVVVIKRQSSLQLEKKDKKQE